MYTKSYGSRFVKSSLQGKNACQYLIATIRKNVNVRHSTIAQKDACSPKKSYLFVVTSGVAKENTDASKVALSSLVDYFTENMPWFESTQGKDHHEIYDKLVNAIEKSHEAVQTFTCNKHAKMTVAYVVWPYLYTIHVGNNRCFLYRSHKMIPIKGQLLHYKKRSRNLLGNDSYEIDFTKRKLYPGDRLLLCTPGLVNATKVRTLSAILTRNKSVKRACQQVLNVVREKGSGQNFSIIVSRFGEDHKNNMRSFDEQMAIWPAIERRRALEKKLPRTRKLAISAK